MRNYEQRPEELSTKPNDNKNELIKRSFIFYFHRQKYRLFQATLLNLRP
jgi:hypothetical protein